MADRVLPDFGSYTSPLSSTIVPWGRWPLTSHRDFGDLQVSLGEVATNEPNATDLLAGEHVLLGTLAGGCSDVEVQAEGAASWRGPKMPGAAGFFPAGRRMTSRWPATRLRYVKLAIHADATEKLLHRTDHDTAWQTRSSAEDSFISATLGQLAAALAADLADRLASLTAETLATALHLHLAARFSNLGVAESISNTQDDVGRVLDLIHAGLPQAATLAEMVEVSGLPRARFLASFARRTGYSPYSYVLRERMARARLLLETTRLAVAEVASVVGCANSGHLNRHYQRQYGSSPLAWRHRHGRS